MSWLPFRRHTAGLPRRTTLAARLLVPICGVTAAALTALVATVATRTASLAERQATEAVSEMAARYAGEIGRDLGTPMTTARVLGQAAEGWKAGGMTSRRTADTTIRSLLERNPQVLGVWTGWEPNAFDGRDDEFARTPSSDATGRYVPYYNRGAGPTAREVLVDYDKPGDGDYYQIPKTSGKETVVEPYVYPVGGKPVLMTSLAVPITVNGRVAGVAGVDLALADVQQRVAAVRPFGTGFAALVSGGGKLLAYPDTALLGKDATGAFTNAETLAALREGRRHVGVAYHERFGGDAIRAVVPVPVAAGSAPWSLVLVVPRAAVLADAHALRATIVGLGVLTLVVLGGVVAYLVRRVTRPLTAVAERAQQLQLGCVTNLRTALEAMAHGDLSAHVEPKTPLLHFAEQDELGDVARAVDGIITDVRATVGAFGAMQGAVRGLVDETRALTAAAEAGRLAERGRAEQYAGAYRELVAGFNGTLDALQAPFAEAAVVLQRAAERDLTARMTGRYRGDHASLQTAVNTALEQLEAELAQVAGGAEQVAAAAAQIAAGGQALAGGTTEQASSLEEIGANLQEMTAMAGQTAAHTREVQGLMAAATESTQRGTASVARLADAVGRIQQSAESTARVVKTIDEIAFQTNLLALNAAVEAARAGDAGRGFAVVAEEVRALALRSAEAAKRTAALIDESGRSVAEGVASARAVTAGFAEIDGHVGRVAGLMREIGAAVDQQAEGVRQVNAGTELINQVTQQNAATAEESAATAEELTGQAAGLSQMMARFQLGGAAAAAPAAARAARRPAPSLARGGVPAPRPGMRAAAAAAASAGPSESARAACVIPFDEDGDDVLGGF